MLSFHINFVQTDRQTDGRTNRLTKVKHYALDLSMLRHKKESDSFTPYTVSHYRKI